MYMRFMHASSTLLSAYVRVQIICLLTEYTEQGKPVIFVLVSSIVSSFQYETATHDR